MVSVPSKTGHPGVAVTEVRVLEGPNLYFSRPAIKVTLDLPGFLQGEEGVLRVLAAELGMRRWRPGSAGSEQRQRFVVRLVERAVRMLASASGTSRLGVRSRAGATAQTVVVAFVWRDRGRGLSLGSALEPLLACWLDRARAVDPQVGELDAGEASDAGDASALMARLGQQIAAARSGEKPAVAQPAIPVASVTGTNGKTTTTRLLAHIGMTAGLRTAWSSTDGVVVHGEVVEPGDYSGPAGARRVLSTPGVQLGILETARGGLLLKGMGVASNDVSVVTNVSADHLGLQGIETVDQLAEVKAIVTTVTRPGGWAVLNGDDPRVWGMRARTRARPWAFSLHPNAPALREALDAGGRGVTVLDGDITVLAPGRDADRLVPVVDVPVTLAGLSTHNVANALAATAAALGLGLPPDAVVRGLRTFQPDARMNFGRMNTFTLERPSGGEVTVIVDLAHNEAGLEALLAVARGLTAAGGRVHLGLGLAGDRTEELLEGMGEVAGRGADVVAVVHKEHYLRGRTVQELERLLRTGLARVGVAAVGSYPDELAGLKGLLDGSADGDVVALMCHAERERVVAWLHEQRATADDADAIRRKVRAARGEHELEQEIASVAELVDPPARVRAAAELSALRPGDPRLTLQYAAALDSAGQLTEAVAAYRRALDTGLREPHRHRARIQLASALRLGGRPEQAVEILADVAAERPGEAAVTAFQALALADLGRETEAVAALVDALARQAADEDTQAYRSVLLGQARRLRDGAAREEPPQPGST